MDFMERHEPREEVLRLRGCVGEFFIRIPFLFCLLTFSPILPSFSLINSIWIGQIVQNGRGCGYVEWHDPPLPEFWSELIGDLRDEVWRLRGLQQAAPHVVQEASDGRLQAMQDELREKTEEIAALKGNYDKVMLAFVVFVFGLLAGKMFMQ
jgi:hypothetical protein